MAVTPETMHYAVESSENFLKIARALQNAVRETIGILGAFSHPDYDFPKSRNDAIAHIETIIDCLGDAFYHNGMKFNDSYNNIVENVTSTAGTGDVNMDVLKDINAYINDDDQRKNEILVPAYMADYLYHCEELEKDIKHNLDWAAVSPKFFLSGEQAKDVRTILLNTICTRDIARENGCEDVVISAFRCIGDYVTQIKETYTPILYDLMEAINSDEMQRVALGVQTGKDQAVVAAGTKTLTNMVNSLVGLANHIIYSMAYCNFYAQSIPALINDALLIEAAYSRYQLESAVHF